MQLSEIVGRLTPHADLLILGVFGGVVLSAHKLITHFNLPPENKLPVTRYGIFFVFVVLGLPLAGFSMVAAYILNGDKLSALLALQVGLTSPAILQSFMVTVANLQQSKPEASAPGQ
jgi:hypothetical protein